VVRSAVQHKTLLFHPPPFTHLHRVTCIRPQSCVYNILLYISYHGTVVVIEAGPSLSLAMTDLHPNKIYINDTGASTMTQAPVLLTMPSLLSSLMGVPLWIRGL
jgi:hypothetical protein